MSNILTVSNVCKSYGKNKVLDDVSISVPKGSIYGLIGKNGAGKTTLMRVIAGLQIPESGSTEHGKNRLGALINAPAYYGNLSAEENLRAQFITLGLTSYEAIPELLKLVKLDHTGRKAVRNFSFGMKQRLGIAIALSGNPDIVLMDEPINGLDPQGIIEIREIIIDINRQKETTFIISSHLLDELSKIATDYAFIDHGRILKEISAKDITDGSAKSYIATVTDTSGICTALDSLGKNYEIISDTKIRIRDEITLGQMYELAQQNGIELTEFTENDTTLEGYYINLVEG